MKILLGISAVLLLITVLTAVVVSAKGSEVVALEKSIQKYDQENRELSEKIVNSNSLNKLATQSESLGMIKPEKVLYLQGENPTVAQR